MKEYKYVSKWEIDEVLEKMPESEKEKFLKKIITKLKIEKINNINILMLEEHWLGLGKAGLVVSGAGIVSILLTESIDDIYAAIAAGSLSIAAICLIACFIGGVMENEDDINRRYIYNKRLEKQLTYLKEKIKVYKKQNHSNKK